MADRVLLKVKAFKTESSGCAIAATASLANYYDKSIDYSTVRKMTSRKDREDGLYTHQQGIMLNKLGFSKVSIVTADLDILDISWSELEKKTQISKLEKAAKYWKKEDSENAEVLRGYVQWLNMSKENKLIIDSDFPKYIRRYLSNRRPVGASVTINSLFKIRKYHDIKGSPDQHAVVLRGYNEKHVFVVDMNFQYVSRPAGKKPRGYYRLTWEKFLCNMPFGDLILIG